MWLAECQGPGTVLPSGKYKASSKRKGSGTMEHCPKEKGGHQIVAQSHRAPFQQPEPLLATLKPQDPAQKLWKRDRQRGATRRLWHPTPHLPHPDLHITTIATTRALYVPLLPHKPGRVGWLAHQGFLSCDWMRKIHSSQPKYAPCTQDSLWNPW